MRLPLKELAKRWLVPDGSIAPILRGACRGMKFRVTPESGRSMILGYEYRQQKFLAAKIRPGMVIFDIGANVGQYTLLFSRCVGPSGRVLSFEPYPPAFRRLEENVKLNGLKNVTALNLALSDKTGQLPFSVHPDSASMGKLSAAEPTIDIKGRSSILVESDLLDRMVSRFGAPHLLKIDTEGAAAVVLAGAESTLRAHKPAIYIELHGPEEQAAVLKLMREDYTFEDVKRGLVVRDFSKWVTPLWGLHL